MNETTIQRLNAINRDFYQVTAESFSETRPNAWPGWKVLLPYFNFEAKGKPYSVLDVGCGNGRFGTFLADYLEAPVIYTGMDNNALMLKFAGETLHSLDNIVASVEQRDVVLDPPTTGEYDVVAMFGLVHHIPGNENRQAFMRKMAARVKLGGFLVFACWRFYEFERFKNRVIAWPDDLSSIVEPHDYLLDWRRDVVKGSGEFAQRYCHYVDNDEHAALIAASGLQAVHTFRADGFTSTVNRYTLLKRA
jgi:tRNA (uracil-5-)-methyltransferase TRM9